MGNYLKALFGKRSTAHKYKLDNLVVIVDRNKLQITGKTEDVNPIEPLNEKFLSFGFNVKEIDGNNIEGNKCFGRSTI